MSTSNNLLRGLLGLGMAGLVGYGAYKGIQYRVNSQREAEEAERRRRIEATQRIAFAHRQHAQAHIAKIDNIVDQLLQSPNQALEVVRDCVCETDETNWGIFAGLLASKIATQPLAKSILAIAHYTREAGQEIAQLICHSVDEAVSLVHDIWNQKDEAERAGFLLALQGSAKSNVRAKAILGRLTA